MYGLFQTLMSNFLTVYLSKDLIEYYFFLSLMLINICHLP